MTRAIFFDIFGTLVDWRGTLIHQISRKIWYLKRMTLLLNYLLLIGG